MFTEVGDPDSIVRPGQTFVYSTTVQNSLKAGTSLWVRGNTQLTVDNIGGYPLGMTYDIPKDKSQSLYSDLTVNTGVGNQQVDLTTDVHSQLHTPSDWGWDAPQSNKTTATSPTALSAVPVKNWSTAYAAISLENQQAKVYTATADGLAGTGVNIFGGANYQSLALPKLACNNSGICLAVGGFHSTLSGHDYFTWRTVLTDAVSLGAYQSFVSDGISTVGVASDGSNFLVTWNESTSDHTFISMVNVLADGSRTGTTFTLDSGPNVGSADLAFIGNQYQAVWNRNNDIYTRYITGTTVSSPSTVSATSAVEDKPRIGYDALSDKSLVVYQSNHDKLLARIVDAAGVSDEINLKSINANLWYHAVQGDPVNGGWVVAYGQYNLRDVYYQGVGMDGGLRGYPQWAYPVGSNGTLDLMTSRPRLSLQLHFDEGSGVSTFSDSSGFNHDGTCSGAKCPLSGQTGKQGSDVKFDGTDDEVRALNVSPSNTAYGVTFWFRTDNCPQDYHGKAVCGLYSVDNGEHMEVNDDSQSYQRYNYYDRDIYLADGSVCARLGRGNTNDEVICTSGQNYGDNQWHFVAHTYGGSVGGQQLYVDGELSASGQRTSSDLPGTLMVRIGRSAEAYSYFPYNDGIRDTFRREKRPYFKGDIDEVTVYPRALSAREIKDAMHSPLAVYAFDETSGATTFNNPLGTGAGKCSGATCPTSGVTGEAYNAVKFDGSNDVITGANVSLVNSSFTVAFWAKREWINRNEYFVSQGVNQPNKDLFIGFWSNNKFICAFDDDGDHLVTTGAYTDTSDWHQWACTYDATTKQRAIYYDGNVVITNTAASNYLGSGALLVGKARWGNYLRGWVDELGVWSEALSAADIKTLYQKVKPLDDSTTEVLVLRTPPNNLDVARTALHETTATLGKSDQQVKDTLTIDAQLPTSQITSLTDNQHLAVTGALIIGGQARDNTFVTQVEVRVDNGAWQTADGVESWVYDWDTSGLSEGSHTLSCRATDAGGNVQSPSSLTVVIDRTPPVITQANTPQQAYLNSQGQWVVPLSGKVDDVTAGALEALLEGGTADVAGYGWQSAQFSGSPRTNWNLNYILPALGNQSSAITNPTGVYTLEMRATDDLGNQRPAAAYSVFQLDNTAPIADVRYTGPNTTVITSTNIVLSGVITDPGPVASGISALQVSFAPVEQRDAKGDATLWLQFNDSPQNQTFIDSARHNNASCQGDACPSIDEAGAYVPWPRRMAFFDGSNDVVQVPASEGLQLNDGTFTLSAWVEPWMDNNGVYGFMGYQTSDGRYYPSLWVIKTPGGQEVRAGFTDTDGVFHQLQTAGLSNYAWNHIAVTYDGTTMRLYTHGQQQGSTAAFANTRPITDAMQIDIGHVDSYFRGHIYDAAVYQRALTSDEVKALYNTGQVQRFGATLAQSGAGVITTTWTLTVPADLEDFYEIQLRGSDVLDNRNNDPTTWTGWEGMIDTTAPRNTPSVVWHGSSFVRTTDVVCDVSDLNLDESRLSGCPIPKSAWQRTYYDQVSLWYARVTTDTERLYRIYASQRFNYFVPGVSVTVCDTPGHCTTTTAPSSLMAQAPDSVQDVLVDSAVVTPTNGTVLSTTTPFNVQGIAQANGYLRALTVTVNSVPFYTTGWPTFPFPGAVTQTNWSTIYTPLSEGHYTFQSTASDWVGNVQTTTYPITITVDLLPPAPPTFDTVVITSALRVYQGATALTGVAADTIGVEQVQVNIDNQGWNDASLDGNVWRYLWRTGDTDPDGATYNASVRAIDLAGHAMTTTTNLVVDMQPPTPVTMTLSYRDVLNVVHPLEPRQTITNGSILNIEWTPSSDGSSLAGYQVGWNTSPTSTLGAVFIPAGTIYSYTQIISEAQIVYAHLVSIDVYGNRLEQVSDPIYVDSPLTPDIVALPSPSGRGAGGGVHITAGWIAAAPSWASTIGSKIMHSAARHSMRRRSSMLRGMPTRCV